MFSGESISQRDAANDLEKGSSFYPAKSGPWCGLPSSTIRLKIKSLISTRILHMVGWGDMSNARRNVQRMNEKQKQTKNRRDDKRLYYQRGFKTLQLWLVWHWNLSYWHLLFYCELIYCTRKKKTSLFGENLARIKGQVQLKIMLWALKIDTMGSQQSYTSYTCKIFAIQEMIPLLSEVHRQIFWWLNLLPWNLRK